MITLVPSHCRFRFTVYFVCSDGSTFALCPVAPFGTSHSTNGFVLVALAWPLETYHCSFLSGCSVPASAVSRLAATLSERGADHASKAWLQQAFPGLPDTWRNGEEHASEALVVHPHALEKHSPALVGPLRIAAIDGEAESTLALIGLGDPVVAASMIA
jgi:hypothetical protein